MIFEGKNNPIQFHLVFDTDEEKLDRLLKDLGMGFITSSQKGLEILTIRHGTSDLIDNLTAGRKVIMEQVNSPTVRRLLAQP